MLTSEEQKLYWKGVEELTLLIYSFEESGEKLSVEDGIDYLRNKFLEYGIINKI